MEDITIKLRNAGISVLNGKDLETISAEITLIPTPRSKAPLSIKIKMEGKKTVYMAVPLNTDEIMELAKAMEKIIGTSIF